MWPAFGVLSLYFWWMLIHTDYENGRIEGHAATASRGGLRGARSVAVRLAGPDDLQSGGADLGVRRRGPELAAYNARLADLAAQGPKTWRKREAVVVRREQ